MPCKYTRCALSLVLAACVCSVAPRNVDTSRAAEDGCDRVRSFLEARNITKGAAADGKVVCGGKCCSAGAEAALLGAGRRDLEALLRHHAKSLHGLLSHTTHTLQDHVADLARESENKTLYLFSQVYQRMSVHSKRPILDFYSDIRTYVSNSTEINSPKLDIEASVTSFFTNLFPLVYHHAIMFHQNDFNEDYKSCLRLTIKEIQPFGDIPTQISTSVFKSLEATRVLLQALMLGSEVLNTTDTLLSEMAEESNPSKSACHVALLKLSHCPKCIGLDPSTKPCKGFCQNVLRGCLAQHVSELDIPWNGYVEAIERLLIAVNTHDTPAHVNIDTVMNGLETRISEAIMYAMENGPSLEKKVKQACGHARLSEEASPAEEAPHASGRQRAPRPARPAPGTRAPAPDAHLSHFLALAARSKGFFISLADKLCRDDSFADQSDVGECWNGQRIGEYSKIVVGPNANEQKYNPEVDVSSLPASKGTPTQDTRVAKLSDKLRNMRALVLKQLLNPHNQLAENYMQGDEAGGVALEGSGSGRVDSFTDEDAESWDEGSGSGYGTIPEKDSTKVTIRKPDAEAPGSQEDSTAAGKSRSTVSVVLSAASLLFLFCARSYCSVLL